MWHEFCCVCPYLGGCRLGAARLVTVGPKAAGLPGRSTLVITGQPVRGYVPGVFDMFHVGHLNIVRAARRSCDFLIVGVVSDQVVERVKGRPPIVPLGERMEIVGALREVDEVVVDDHSDKFDSWTELHYDAIFKGDDWRGTPKGEKLERDLARVGARVHYFPYTRHTSSTALRQALDDLVRPTTWPPEWAAVVAAAAEAYERLAHTSQGPA